MQRVLRIGTRDSQLAVWQATLVKDLLQDAGISSELVYIKSEGDIDTITPLYALGVQGVFTKTLDAALLSKRIDLAVHSMKDVPTQLAQGIQQAAVLKRASHKDILVFKNDDALEALGYVNRQWAIVNSPETSSIRNDSPFTIATSSIRRMAQWLNRYPHHNIENLRGNVNTRLRKVEESTWQGAIFAAAGLERIEVRPQNSIDLDWMLPAPAQGAIMVVCRSEDTDVFYSCQTFNDKNTTLCTKVERDFLRTLMGGCSTPISALAVVNDNTLHFKGNICSPNGTQKVDIEEELPLEEGATSGVRFANQLLTQPSAYKIVQDIRNAKK